jgi:hypothetical protein
MDVKSLCESNGTIQNTVRMQHLSHNPILNDTVRPFHTQSLFTQNFIRNKKKNPIGKTRRVSIRNSVSNIFIYKLLLYRSICLAY